MKKEEASLAGKRFLKMAAAAVLSLAVVFSASAGAIPAKADTMNSLQQKQASLQQQQKQYDAQLAQLKNDKSKQQQYKDTLDAQIKGLQSLIDTDQAQIDALDADILKNQQAIASRQAEVKADFDLLKQRVYALYLTGEASDIEIILNAKNIMDLADKAEFLQVIAQHDNDLMKKVKADISSIQAQQTQIQNDRQSASAHKTSLDSNRSTLAAKSNEVQQVIAALGASQSQTETQKAQGEKELQATTQQLNQMVADYQALQKKLQEQQARQQQRNTGGGTSGGTTGGTSGGVTPHGGKFVWPVPGYMNITSSYGWRDDPREFHYGVDIASSGIYGKKIVAAASGVVVRSDDEEDSGPFGGYGNVVVIAIGGDMVVVCGHMSQRAVSYGDSVSAGDTIGYVGSTGNSTGPHLHFEVRSDFSHTHTNLNGTTTNGQAIDPRPYLGI